MTTTAPIATKLPKLAPCSCGEDSDLRIIPRIPGGKYSVRCGTCGTASEPTAKKMAPGVWNARHRAARELQLAAFEAAAALRKKERELIAWRRGAFIGDPRVQDEILAHYRPAESSEQRGRVYEFPLDGRARKGNNQAFVLYYLAPKFDFDPTSHTYARVSWWLNRNGFPLGEKPARPRTGQYVGQHVPQQPRFFDDDTAGNQRAAA